MELADKNMNLTQFSYYARQFLPIGIILFLLLFVGYYGTQVYFLYLESTRPKPLVLNTLFGKLPNIVLKNATPSIGYNFSIDTVSGRPETATSSAAVYFLPASSASLNAKKRAFSIAKTLGMEDTPQDRLDGRILTLTSGNHKLEVDIATYNFSYEYKLENQDELFENISIPSEMIAKNNAVDFLKKLEKYPEELARGETKAILLNYSPTNQTVSTVDSPQDANLVEVDFYRGLVNDVQTVSPTFFTSQNYVVLMYHNNNFQVVKSRVNFFEKIEEPDKIGVYPVRTGENAYERLKNGEAFVVSSPKSGTKDVRITAMYMAYLEPEEYTEYFQPVYVFEGDDNFVAYLPAVADGYVEGYDPPPTQAPAQ